MKQHAENRGVSPSAYVREVLEMVAKRPPPEEVWARIDALEPVEPIEPAAVTIRRIRESGDWQ